MKQTIYTPNDFVDGKTALKMLGLHKDEYVYVNVRYLKQLVERGLLTHHKINSRVIKYLKKECLELFNKHINEGISLTVKPTKKAA